MDLPALVSKELIQSGEELLRKLPNEGLEVAGAAWAKTEDDGQPYLYVISPTVEQVGPLEATQRLVRVLRELDKGWTDPFRRLDPFGIKLVRPSDTLAQGVLEVNHRWPDSRPTWHRGVLGLAYVEGAYIYPAKMFIPPEAQPTA